MQEYALQDSKMISSKINFLLIGNGIVTDVFKKGVKASLCLRIEKGQIDAVYIFRTHWHRVYLQIQPGPRDASDTVEPESRERSQVSQRYDPEVVLVLLIG